MHNLLLIHEFYVPVANVIVHRQANDKQNFIYRLHNLVKPSTKNGSVKSVDWNKANNIFILVKVDCAMKAKTVFAGTPSFDNPINAPLLYSTLWAVYTSQSLK